MDFRLPLPVIKSEFSISHADKLLVIGSCFTENIGHLLARYAFPTCINPFGIIYNPYSIFKALEYIHQQNQYAKQDLSKRDEIYFSFDHHGSFSDINKQACLDKINTQIEEAHAFLQETNIIFITLGTSFVYELTENKRIVANCHKMPASIFHKRLLSKEEIIAQFNAVHRLISEKTKIIFTVSPVRHWRDGAVENSVSKAILIAAVYDIVQKHKNCFYFPAYELVMDDLRDYRFYAKDMLHPNELATAYIWERFKEAYFSEDTNQILLELQALRQAMEHRPLFSDSENHQKFISDLDIKKEQFRKKYPYLSI